MTPSAMSEKEVIHVVDDDLSVRRGIARLLRSRGYVAQVHEDPRPFLENLPVSAVGCVILDLDMPGLDGLEVQRALIARCSALPIVFLSGRGTVANSVQAMKCGAVDFLEKPVDEVLLFAVVEKALDDGRTRRQKLRETEEAQALVNRLTEREYAVFELMVKGFTSDEVGDFLGISRDTVKVHRARVMKKLEADSLADAILLYHMPHQQDK
jgi:FixJ family two-component response regulator